MALDFDTYNSEVQQWSKDIVRDSKSTAQSVGVQHRQNSPSPAASVSKINSRVGFKEGIAQKVSIKFPRSLIWTQKGAGKGMAGTRGSRWIDKYGTRKTTSEKSYGKAGTGSRKEKDFFNTALDSSNGVDKLATIAAQHIGAAITNNLFIK
jgi:hypothetical protein